MISTRNGSTSTPTPKSRNGTNPPSPSTARPPTSPRLVRRPPTTTTRVVRRGRKRARLAAITPTVAPAARTAPQTTRHSRDDCNRRKRTAREPEAEHPAEHPTATMVRSRPVRTDKRRSSTQVRALPCPRKNKPRARADSSASCPGS